MTPLELATLFHNTYEALGPVNGYETRPETRRFDPTSPNGKTMIATAAVVLSHLGHQHIAEQAQKVHDIHEDIRDFDGDKRGMYGAADEAEKELLDMVLECFPDRKKPS